MASHGEKCSARGASLPRVIAGFAMVILTGIPDARGEAAGGEAAAVVPTRSDHRFAAVVPGRDLEFPADGGAHPAFRTEWWYATGWLRDEAGMERGFQLTFFRVRTGIGEDNPSRFAPRQLILAHAAIADPDHGRLIHDQRAARDLPPLVGAVPTRTEVWVDDWSLEWSADRYRASVAAEAFSFDLALSPSGPPMLNGDDGFSRKAADPRYASYYYSRPQLRVAGELRLSGRVHRVEGHAWLDHEWSSELMPPGAQGWDWIGINLDDGGAVMAFRMRSETGEALWSGGTVRSPTGETRVLQSRDVRFVPVRRWRSARSGIEYPVEWTVALEQGGRSRRLRIVPLMDDQELDSRASTGAIYWEGAVRVKEGGREIGRGYLEMTGYGDRPPL